MIAGLHLLPGAIDAHVHFREPGYTHKEDWRTGTAAAAMGGVTTVFEMPNTDPPTGTVEALGIKQRAAAKAHVDYGLYGLLAEDNLDRHWRNVRTHSLHDPVRWKYHAVGNHSLNGINPPRHGAI